jgi:hypothetical protein
MHAPRVAPSITKDAIDARTAGRSLSMEEQRLSMRDQPLSPDLVIVRLLEAHTSIINSERQALWQAYAALLLANAIMLAMFPREQGPTMLQAYFASGFGLALCTAWLVLTLNGFAMFFMRLDASSQVSWSQLADLGEYANPFDIDSHWAQRLRARWVFRMAVFVIVLFMLGYVFLLAHYLYYTLVFFEGPP